MSKTVRGQHGRRPQKQKEYLPIDREIGTDFQDIPGGRVHYTNPETSTFKTQVPVKRPMFEGMQAHGVEMDDYSGYDLPEGDKTFLVPEYADAEPLDVTVPVRIVETEDRVLLRRETITRSITIPPQGTEAARICNIDRSRVSIHLLNEDAVTNIRFSNVLSQLAENKGSYLPAITNSYLKLTTQGELWAVTDSTTLSANLSIIVETEVAGN